MIRVDGYAFIYEMRHLLLRITSEHGFAVRGAVKRETLANRGERDEPLPPGNLVDENG